MNWQTQTTRKIIRFEQVTAADQQAKPVAQGHEDSWLFNDAAAVEPDLMMSEHSAFSQRAIEPDQGRVFTIDSLAIYEENNQFYLADDNHPLELKQDDRLIIGELTLVVHIETNDYAGYSQSSNLGTPSYFEPTVPLSTPLPSYEPRQSQTQTIAIEQYHPNSQLASQSLLPEVSGSIYPGVRPPNNTVPPAYNQNAPTAQQNTSGNVLRDLGLFDDHPGQHLNTALEYGSLLGPGASSIPTDAGRSSLFADENYLPVSSAKSPSGIRKLFSKYK